MRLTAILTFVAVVQVGSASMAAQQPANGLPPKANLFGNQLSPPSKPSSPPRFLFPTPAPNVRPAPKIDGRLWNDVDPRGSKHRPGNPA